MYEYNSTFKSTNKENKGLILYDNNAIIIMGFFKKT